MKTLNELGTILSNAYENAPRGKQVVMVHLFGIQYKEDIRRVGIKEVVEASGIPKSFNAEVNKGVNLADYVQLRK